MTELTEGIIRYKTKEYRQELLHKHSDVSELEYWREILFNINLIGEYEDKIGFGNLSKRFQKKGFLITASQTGSLPHLKNEHYCLVSDFNLSDFSLSYAGLLPASSEALTHGALYEADLNINYVFHIHHEKIWKGLLEDGEPKVSKGIDYGSPEMAETVKSLAKDPSINLIAMEGHKDGVLSFGNSAFQTGQALLNTFQKYIL